MNKEQFYEETIKIGIKLTDFQKHQLEIYKDFLKEENQKYNLTSLEKDEEIYLKHFYDSMTLIKSNLNIENAKVLDIGTGAGFPGLIIKILFPTIELYLVESSSKKCQFLEKIFQKLMLNNVFIVNKRMEEAKEINDMDIVISRAVAKTNILLEYGTPVLRLNGFLVAMKSDKEELDFGKACFELKCKHLETISFELPFENSKRKLVIFEKTQETPKKYPRNYSQMKTKPL